MSISHTKEILWLMAKTDFKLRYNGSTLGFIWALLKPLLIFIILHFVFSNIFGGDIEHYGLWLLTGIMLWTYFAEGTMTVLTSQLSKSHILTKIHISKWVILGASLINTSLTFLINLGLLSVFFLWEGVFPSLLTLPHIMLYLMMIILSIFTFGLFTSLLYVRFRDLNQIWEVLLTGGFYLCPIIFPPTILPSHLHWVLLLNPMTLPIINIRSLLFGGDFVYDIQTQIWYMVILLLLMFIGIRYFTRQASSLTDYL